VTVLDQSQTPQKVIMGCYGIGVNRILAAALESERGHDDRGIIWPKSIAPYHVVITPIKYEGAAAKAVADRLYAELTDAGVDVLLDDRDERPGVKFNDADLIGIPLRITVGDKGLANGEVELKGRTAANAENVKVEAVVGKVVKFIEE
jgi:prolyl-tRNA synthetase